MKAVAQPVEKLDEEEYTQVAKKLILWGGWAHEKFRRNKEERPT